MMPSFKYKRNIVLIMYSLYSYIFFGVDDILVCKLSKLKKIVLEKWREGVAW